MKDLHVIGFSNVVLFLFTGGYLQALCSLVSMPCSIRLYFYLYLYILLILLILTINFELIYHVAILSIIFDDNDIITYIHSEP